MSLSIPERRLPSVQQSPHDPSPGLNQEISPNGTEVDRNVIYRCAPAAKLETSASAADRASEAHSSADVRTLSVLHIDALT
jgi:hypothetical protein